MTLMFWDHLLQSWALHSFCLQFIFWSYKVSWAPSQYPERRLLVRSRKVSKPRDWYFKLSYRFEIWQAHRQHCCRSACQISERSDNSKYKSRGFETLRDLTKRRLFGYWDGSLIPLNVYNVTSDSTPCASLIAKYASFTGKCSINLIENIPDGSQQSVINLGYIWGSVPMLLCKNIFFVRIYLIYEYCFGFECHYVLLLLQWNLSITTTLWDISLPSGAYLGGQGPPRWAPEGRNC